MARMFANAIRLERINISSWNMRDLDIANMFLNNASMQEITLGRLSVLENTGFGNNMYFYETHPTNATGSASQRNEVFWRFHQSCRSLSQLEALCTSSHHHLSLGR